MIFLATIVGDLLVGVKGFLVAGVARTLRFADMEFQLSFNIF